MILAKESEGRHCCDVEGGGMGGMNNSHSYWVIRTTGGSLDILRYYHYLHQTLIDSLQTENPTRCKDLMLEYPLIGIRYNIYQL